MYIPIILGTARKGRRSEYAARFMLEKVKDYGGIKTELLDVKDYRIKATDNTQNSSQAKKLKSKISKANGIIIVSPEYNHGYPGELKMMLDMLYEQFHYKPVGICGVSAGGLGGARMVEVLRLSCIEFKMVPIREAVYFSNIQDLFDDHGNIKDNSYHNKAKIFLNELILYAKKLNQ
ncbi:NAD(P)H-dependent oxidoreductase [Candidatus Woesearchaeota archaeon]|nr:NAD(P)H-dependent oxidoreductase [Candidatus Woesearchaeota archaeon]